MWRIWCLQVGYLLRAKGSGTNPSLSLPNLFLFLPYLLTTLLCSSQGLWDQFPKSTTIIYSLMDDFERGSCCVAQTGCKCSIPLPMPLKCWKQEKHLQTRFRTLIIYF